MVLRIFTNSCSIVLHEIALTPSENIMPKTHKHPRWIPELPRGSWCFMLSGSCKLCASKIWCELGDSFQLKVKAFWINETRLSIKLKCKVFMHRTVTVELCVIKCSYIQNSSCWAAGKLPGRILNIRTFYDTELKSGANPQNDILEVHVRIFSDPCISKL